jgi:hypothetical protein
VRDGEIIAAAQEERFTPKTTTRGSSFVMAMPLWVREKLLQKSLLHSELKQFSKEFDWERRLLFAEHPTQRARFIPRPLKCAHSHHAQCQTIE